MQRPLIFILYFLIFSHLFSQETNYKEKRLIDFQQKLIDDKITASNQIIIFKGDKIVYQNIQNSFKPGDKEINSKDVILKNFKGDTYKYPRFASSVPNDSITTIKALSD